MKFDPFNDGISSVELIDHMGSDLTVVNAARVSMAKESDWEKVQDGFKSITTTDEWSGERINIPTNQPKYVKRLSKRDCGLISYLAKHNHWTPFGHPQIQLRIKMPIFVARQWFKHMIGFNRNEVSRRYVDDTPEFYVPTEWRKRAENVKQGSSDEVLENSTELSEVIREDVYDACLGAYQGMIEGGICPEQARMVLPQSMYTEFVEVGSLAAYARLAKLRLDPHAQKEVRLYAEAVDKIMAQLFPVSWAALMGVTNA